MTLDLVSLALAASVIVLAAAVVWFAGQLRAGRADALSVTARLEATTAELDKARTELKSLSGLLPMCAWCKKIRDDAGYWQQLEGYISSHADVEFSHSACPDCTQRIQADMPDAKWRI